MSEAPLKSFSELAAISVEYAIEPLAQCRKGVESLMHAHSKEFTYYLDKKGPVSPDWAFAEYCERIGRLRILTVRHEGRLVGYFMMTSCRSPHYDIKLCIDDTFYLAPEFRGHWGLYNFVKRAVAEMEDMGGPGSALVVANKYGQDLAPIWKRLGFKPEEIRWTKMAGK